MIKSRTILGTAAMLMSIGLMLSACDQKPAKPESEPSSKTQSTKTTVQPNTTKQDASRDNHPTVTRTKAKSRSFESRYDRPTDIKPAPRATAPLGHAVAVAGYDLHEADAPKLAWQDPANNLVDGQGIHRWSVSPKLKPVQRNNGHALIDIDDRQALIFGLVLVEPTDNKDTQMAERWLEQDMPDLSQHAGNDWHNFCAPTAGADVLYSLASEDPGLRAHLPMGPGGLAQTAANQCIAGSAAPPVRSGSLAQQMQSSTTRGTSAKALALGLSRYLDRYAANASTWRVRYVGADALAGPDAMLDRIQRAMSRGGGAVLALTWAPNESPGSSTIAKSSSSEDDSNALKTSDDTNASQQVSRNQPGVYESSEAHRSTADLTSDDGGDTSVQVTNTAPHRHKPSITQSDSQSPGRSQPVVDDQLLDTSLPSAPAEVDLPPIKGVVQTHTPSSTTPTMSPRKIHGRWKQTGGSHAADFAPGSYVRGELQFSRDGILRVRRHYGTKGNIVLAQRFVYELAPKHNLVIKPINHDDNNLADQSPPANNPGFMTAVLKSWTGHEPTIELPARMRFTLHGDHLTLMNRTYRRAQ